MTNSSDFDKALEAAAFKYATSTSVRWNDRDDPMQSALGVGFIMGSRWSRDFTIAEVIKKVQSDFFFNGIASGDDVADFIEQHFKAKG